jgi:hypothetical protein
MAVIRTLLLSMLVACAAPRALGVPAVTLPATAGAPATYPRDLAAARFTVFVFFSKDCLCFTAHEARLRELATTFGPRGVSFVIVDPETGRTLDGDAREAQARDLPVPIHLDPGAVLARALGAEYATYSVVVDASGQIRYRGGIDDDKTHLRDDRTTYLADALDDLVAGRAPRRAEGKTLGCSLQTW